MVLVIVALRTGRPEGCASAGLQGPLGGAAALDISLDTLAFDISLDALAFNITASGFISVSITSAPAVVKLLLLLGHREVVSE